MLKASHDLQQEIIEWRRDFHMHPELGVHEVRTSEHVAEELTRPGYGARRHSWASIRLAHAKGTRS